MSKLVDQLQKPLSTSINTFGTGVMVDTKLSQLVDKVFDARPASIIDELGLRKPLYTATSSYGHFGREEFPWEKLNRVSDLQ